MVDFRFIHTYGTYFLVCLVVPLLFFVVLLFIRSHMTNKTIKILRRSIGCTESRRKLCLTMAGIDLQSMDELAHATAVWSHAMDNFQANSETVARRIGAVETLLQLSGDC